MIIHFKQFLEKSKDGHVLNPSKLERFKNKELNHNTSIFYDLLRKIKHKYYNW